MSNTQSFTINPGVSTIDYPTGLALIQSEQCTLIDVREPDEYAAGFIPGAILLPLSRLSAAEAKRVMPNVARPVIIYCRTGRRSHEAALKLKDFGYYYLLDLGGISKWPYAIEVPKSQD